MTISRFLHKSYWVIIVLVVLWSIYSLPYSPIAWYDEVFFSSMSHSLLVGNGLALELDKNEPFYIYGPVYFVLTWVFTKIGGFGIVTFRLVNLLFSFGCVIVLGKILRRLQISSFFSCLIKLIFMTDVLFISNGHSGRMEFVALFWILCAYLYWIRKGRLYYVFVSFFLTLAILTTPRSAVVAFPLAINVFIDMIKGKKGRQLLVYVSIPIVLYLAWIFSSYGSVDNFILSFSQTNGITQNASLVQRFLGGNVYIPKWNIPLVFLSIVIVLDSFISKYFQSLFIYILPILFFYLFIYDTGLYSVYILPFYMIVLSFGYAQIKNRGTLFRNLYMGILIGCLILNLGVLSMKSVLVLSTKEMRNPYTLSSWLSEKVPPHSRIVGSCEYYYAAIDNDCQFKKLFRDYTDADVVYNYLENTYKPQYLFLSASEADKDVLKNVERFKKVLIGQYSIGNELKKNSVIYKLFKNSTQSSYDGSLYKIISE